MNTLPLRLAAATLLFVSFSRADDSFAWALRAGGEGNDKIRGIAATGDGGVFVTGEISGETDFGNHRLSSAGRLDFVIAKIDNEGQVVWAKSVGGPEIDRGYAVAPDSEGGCFVTGHFQSETVAFGEHTLTNRGDYDGFIVRYDKSGAVQWAKRFGGENYDFGHGISTAPDGNVVVSGTIANLGDLEGKPVGGENSRSAIVAKFSPGGKMIWSSTATGPSISGHNVSVGADGSVYLAGYGRGEITWSESVMTTSKVQDICIAKYNADAEFQWVQQAGGESDGVATSVAVCPKTGNVCLAGMFKGTARFGESEFVSRGGHDFFATVFSPNGKVLSTHHGSGPGTDYALGATTLNDGEGFAVTGEFTGEVKVDDQTYSGAGERDAYILTLPSDRGEVEIFKSAGGPDHDLSYAVAATSDGGIVISGAFRNETRFGTHQLTAKKGNDIFVAKFLPAKNTGQK